MTTTRKTPEQARKSGGKMDRGKLDQFTEADIERMAREDGEAQSFPKKAKPARVTRPYEPAE